MAQRIIKALKKEHKKRGDKCGATIITIHKLTGISYNELKTMLNELYKSDKIKIRKGINHKLVFLK